MWAVNCGRWTYGKNTSHFPGQNRNRHEKSLSVFFPPSLPRVLHLIRHTLISLLFSNFSNAFWQQISHKKCLCPCVKKISSVFRGLWSIIVIFRHLFFPCSLLVCLCCKLESWQAFQWEVSEVTSTASASKMALNWLKSLKLSQRSEAASRCIYKVNNWRSRRVRSLSLSLSPESCWQSAMEAAQKQQGSQTWGQCLLLPSSLCLFTWEDSQSLMLTFLYCLFFFYVQPERHLSIWNGCEFTQTRI